VERAGPDAEGPRVELWRGRDGVWRWRFVDPAQGVELRGSRGFASRDAAHLAARIAYPELPVVERTGPPDGGSGPSPLGSAARLLLTTGAVVGGAAATVKLAGAAIRLRRWVRRARQAWRLAAAVLDHWSRPS
jgi:hypothetical protein